MASSKDLQEIKSALLDLQSGMKWVLNMVGTSINNTQNVANDARYISNQLDYHASRIEDNTRDLHELMEKVDYLKKDVQKLTKMAEGSHCNENTEERQMEDPSVGNQPSTKKLKNDRPFSLGLVLQFLCFSEIYLGYYVFFLTVEQSVR